IFGRDFVDQVMAFGMSEVLATTGSPWQRAYIERLIGTIRRECLDHVIVLSEHSLRRHLIRFVAYYLRSRTHLALNKDAPIPRHLGARGRPTAASSPFRKLVACTTATNGAPHKDTPLAGTLVT